MSNISCCDCLNSNCLIQRYNAENLISEIDVRKSQYLYHKGQAIIVEGSPVTGIYFICKGNVKVISTGFNEKEQIVRLASDGHILGHHGYGGEVYPIGAIALVDSRICFIDNESLYEFYMKNPRFTYGMMMFYSNELRRIEERIKFLSQMTVKEKVAESILYFSEAFSKNGEPFRLKLTLPRSDIANLAGTNADQVSRMISEFKSEGILDTNSTSIIIKNIDSLKSMISEYYHFRGHSAKKHNSY